MKTKGVRDFSWQGGYAAFSVSSNDLDRIKNYIKNQPEHHARRGFQDELRILFNEYNVDFDEKYVWG